MGTRRGLGTAQGNRQSGVEEQWLACVRVRLNQHGSEGHVSDHAAKTVREGSAGAEDGDANDGLQRVSEGAGAGEGKEEMASSGGGRRSNGMGWYRCI